MITMPRLPTHDSATTDVLRLLRHYRLDLTDLVAIGGEDLCHPNPTISERARRVARVWARMARLGLTYDDLETDRC
jgi:hypothetical protein